MTNDELYHVNVIECYRDLSWEIPSFIERSKVEVIKVVHKCPAELHLADGTKVIFVSKSDYPWWCKGRTYWIDDKKYRSDHLIKDEKEGIT